MFARSVFFSLPVLLIAGCGSNAGEFPSLAKRPIESQGETATAAPSPSAPGPSIGSAAQRRIETAIGLGESSEVSFNIALAAAQTAVESAKGAAFGSESWINAQMVLSALEQTQGPLKSAIADLDEEARLFAESGGSGGLIVTAQARLAAIDARQSAIVEELTRKLSAR